VRPASERLPEMDGDEDSEDEDEDEEEEEDDVVENNNKARPQKSRRQHPI